MQLTGWLALLLRGQRGIDRPDERQQEEIYVYLVSGLIQSGILVISWVHIMDSSEAVAKRLEAQAPGAAASRPTGAPLPSAADSARLHWQARYVDQCTAVRPAIGERWAGDDEGELDDTDAFTIAPAPVTVTTISEEAERVTAARLLRRFKLAVTAFILGFTVIIFLPAFTSASGSTITDISLVLWNGLLLMLCMALAWTFRIKEVENVYLQLGDEAEGNDVGNLETQIEMSGMSAGVARADERAREPPVEVDAGAADPDEHFTLDEDEK